MDVKRIQDLHDQQRIDITYHGMQREVTSDVVRHISVEDKWGIVLYSRLDAGNADRVIQDQIDYFAGLSLDFEWKFYGHDTPLDLRDRLIAHGLMLDELDALMGLDIESVPSILLQPIMPEVRRTIDSQICPAVILQ